MVSGISLRFEDVDSDLGFRVQGYEFEFRV
jgi:hypothetical protein